jgi:hypothetical protein
MIKKCVFLLVALMILCGSPVWAGDDYPTMGMVYNIKEDSVIKYDCRRMQNDLLECDFVQTAIRKKKTDEDLKNKIEEAKKQLPDAIKEASQGTCSGTDILLNAMEGKITPEKAADLYVKFNKKEGSSSSDEVSDKKFFIKTVKEMVPSKKQDTVVFLRSMNEFCKTRSEESWLKIAKQEHEKEMRTCSVSSNPFKQTFKWVEDYSGKGTWVADAKPDGPCGIVQLSRFEAVTDAGSTMFWKYIAKKAITNPKGETSWPGLSCSDLDENEYVYDWKNDKYSKLGCEYIEFSPI